MLYKTLGFKLILFTTLSAGAVFGSYKAIEAKRIEQANEYRDEKVDRCLAEVNAFVESLNANPELRAAYAVHLCKTAGIIEKDEQGRLLCRITKEMIQDDLNGRMSDCMESKES